MSRNAARHIYCNEQYIYRIVIGVYKSPAYVAPSITSIINCTIYDDRFANVSFPLKYVLTE